jgi:aspartate carbamoyltransferase catalytic subunit
MVEKYFIHRKSLIEIGIVTRKTIENLFFLADQAKKNELSNTLRNKIIASCFFEASTRTRLSFESAIYRLGANSIGFSDSQQTSLGQKGESLEDTITVVSSYADAIIIRHPEEGSVKNLARILDIPVINAGDGSNEHPTQTLLDLYTMKKKFKTIDNLRIAMVGDLKYGRTVHSLSHALANFTNIEIYYVAPEKLQIPHEIISDLLQKDVVIHQFSKIEEIIPLVDVIYMTRLQKERFKDNEFQNFDYMITKSMLEKYAKKDLIILHPLPRVREICRSVDTMKHAWYFEQARNGVYIRQAILYDLFYSRNS